MASITLHPSQIQILYTLRHSHTARYTDLRLPTGMESDVFKFHLRNLVKARYVHKTTDGHYQLTAAGKEYANALGDNKTSFKQPKISLVIIVSRQSPKDETEYLFQQRLRQPFWGFWGLIGGPAEWGTAFETTAVHELHKQTGLYAQLSVSGMLRKQDYAEGSKEILEDKLFIIMSAQEVEGTLATTWSGGNNKWLTLSELCQQEQYFAESEQLLQYHGATSNYQTIVAQHHSEQY